MDIGFWQIDPSAERSDGVYRPPVPSACAEEHRRRRVRAGDCLSPQGEFEPDPAGFEHRRLPRRSRGRRQQGRLSFAYFSLAKQRKVSALSGAHPDKLQSPRKLTPSTRIGFKPLHPKESPCLA